MESDMERPYFEDDDEAADWTIFCKRTEDPKLAYIESMLDAHCIPHRRHGDSFHAPILQVPAPCLDDAMTLLKPIDEVRDDHPRFRNPYM